MELAPGMLPESELRLASSPASWSDLATETKSWGHLESIFKDTGAVLRYFAAGATP